MQVIRKNLLDVNGIGPETADSILLYAFGKPVFVIDAYTKRVLSRHGIMGDEKPYDEATPLYLRPAQPLSDDEIFQIVPTIEQIKPQYGMMLSNEWNILDFARAIEQALKEKTDLYAEKFANPYGAAARGFIDEVIEPATTRLKLIRAYAMLENKVVNNPRKKHGNIPL